ncbi:RNA polymerase sigma factor [Caldithrix abyssi]|uniref:RNA polymerase sigma factor n=1 Tax=Caldithrix abyssi DSM 13497 TaxID=880073 RepID=H1XRR1_CALAY|nr:sigma-70 family RNA polymerase sigma factor [Caldithrix abyssi]APF17131.1 RNA polymerase, sigma-24 subunit, RpoE [Caldithrix abyssi DSM 13497]EHO41271.1 RNA polymerase, sigma-24 subunit, ECF subfamily [Caldithrix abyssi DSM 13497]
MDEQEIVQRAKNGDRAALAQLVNKYSDRIYNLALRILRRKEDAEDVLQETFLTVIEKLDKFDGRSSFFTWIYRIATNAALMRLRKKKVVFQELNDDPDFQESIESRVFVDWSQDPSVNVFDEEIKQKLNEAINKLSDIYRSVFVLRDIEGLSIKETSEILNITEENVKIRLRRARQFLRNYLSDYFEERLRESNASS